MFEWEVAILGRHSNRGKVRARALRNICQAAFLSSLDYFAKHRCVNIDVSTGRVHFWLVAIVLVIKLKFIHFFHVIPFIFTRQIYVYID